MKFNQFYRNNGFKRLSNFTSPIILKEDSFSFPYNSSFSYFKPINIIENITNETPLLKNATDVVVRNKTYYSGEEVGNFRRVNLLESKIIKDMRKASKSFRFPLSVENKVTIKLKTLQVFNYTTLHKRYIYTSYSLFRVHMFYNALETLVSEVNKDKTENKFIYIELPDTILEYSVLNRLIKDDKKVKVRKLTDYRMFLMLELWKYITKDPEYPSVLDKLENKDDVILLLSSNGKVIPMALGILDKFISNKAGNIKTESDNIYNVMDFDNLLKQLNIICTDGIKTEADLSFYRIKAIDSVILRKLFIILWNKLLTSNDAVEQNNNLMETKEEEIVIDVSKPVKEVSAKDLKESVEKELQNIIVEDIPTMSEEGFDAESFEVEDIEEETKADNHHQIKSSLRSDYNDVNVEQLLSGIDKIAKDINKKKIEELRLSGAIQKSKFSKLMDVVEEKKKIETPYKEMNKYSIEEINSSKDDEKALISRGEGSFTDNPVVLDKSQNKDDLKLFTQKYVKEYFKKDTIKVLSSLEKSGFLINSYNMEEKSSILNTMQTHTMEYTLLNGKKTKVMFYLPKIEEDGTFKLNKNTYKLRLQRTEVPISKLDNTTVLLNSYYGKLFVTKASRKSEDYGENLLRKINLSERVTKLILEKLVVYDVKLPKLYEMFMRNIKSFRFDGIDFTFDYLRRCEGLNENKIKETETKYKAIYIGKSSKYEYYLGEDDKIYYLDNGLKEYHKLHEELNIDNGLYSEFVSVKVLGKQVPVYLLLAYYIGLENLFKLLKVNYTIVKEGRPKLQDDEYQIKLEDAYIVVKRDKGVGDIILSGASREKALSKVSLNSFNTKDTLGAVFTYLGYNMALKNEIAMLENFYIDPMTKELLLAMKEPTTFVLLLKRASEMLVTDQRKDIKHVEAQTIKGVERINGMLYKELMKSLKEFELKSVFGRNNFTFDPYSVIKALKDDNTTILVDDLNPVISLAQKREVTLLGAGGRDILTIKHEDRKYVDSYFGTYTEHYKDNGDSGVNAQLTSSPCIVNVRGLLDNSKTKIDGSGDVYSIAGLLRPLSDRDDGKRLNLTPIAVMQWCKDR